MSAVIEFFHLSPYLSVDLIWALDCLLFGYLFGSIPFGFLLTKYFGLGDVRDIGSGNIGATNVLRTGNKKVAALTLACDMLKGLLPVLILEYGFEEHILASFAALGALLGHCYPVWLKFKGGKGVATGLGVLFGLGHFVGLACAIAWLFMAVVLKRSSLSALVAIGLAPIFMYVIGDPSFTIAVLLIAIIIFVRHRANIARLINGTEPKIGEKK